MSENDAIDKDEYSRKIGLEKEAKKNEECSSSRERRKNTKLRENTQRSTCNNSI